MQSITLVGNLTRDPELRFAAASGKPRATFSIAINEGEGDNEKTHFVNVTAFGTLGENVAASLRKGQRVLMVGRLDTYSKPVQVDGVDKNLTMTNFIASAVGPDLRWAVADVSKVARSESQDAPAEAAAPKAAPKAEAKAAAPAKAKAAARGRSTAPVDEDDEF